jgi:hypothetical protein
MAVELNNFLAATDVLTLMLGQNEIGCTLEEKNLWGLDYQMDTVLGLEKDPSTITFFYYLGFNNGTSGI